MKPINSMIMKCMVDDCRMVTIYEFCPVHKDEETWECDGCGEIKHDDGRGESTTVGGYGPTAIDPPEHHWVCSNCVYLAEEAQVDRAEARMDNYGEYPPGYDGR